MPRSQQRSQIALPAQGMIEFRDALTDLLDEFGTDDFGAFIVGHSITVAHRYCMVDTTILSPRVAFESHRLHTCRLVVSRMNAFSLNAIQYKKFNTKLN